MRKLFIPATVIAVTTLSVSCATNRPAPADANGEEWTSEIRKSYPDWQPPAEMPQGNPEYNAMFDNKGADVEEQPIVRPVIQTTNDAETKKNAADAGTAGVKTSEPKTSDEKVSEVKSAEPAKPVEFARIDIESATGSLLLNGFEKTDAEVEEYLKSAVAQVPDFAIIIMYNENAGDRMRAFSKKAKDLGIKKINAMTQKDLLNAQLDLVSGKGKTTISETATTTEVIDSAKTAQNTRMKYVVDDTQEASVYTVIEGDSLSIIAKKQYHDGALWPILLEANKDALNGNPDKLVVGKKLNVPVLKQVPASSK